MPLPADPLRRAATLDCIVTGTEQEALILENNLIKKYRPRYNDFLKDDKTFVWDMVRPCGEDPCPVQRITGSWSVRHGDKLYLTPEGGEDEVWTVSYDHKPRKLTLKNDKTGHEHGPLDFVQ